MFFLRGSDPVAAFKSLKSHKKQGMAIFCGDRGQKDQETDGTQCKEGPRKDELSGHENCLGM